MTPDLLPPRHPLLQVAEFDVAFVVFDPRDHRVHHVGDVAAVVFDGCDGRTTRADLVAEICEATTVDTQEVEAIVSDALDALAREGLLAGTEPPVAPPCLGCGQSVTATRPRRWWVRR